MRPLIFALLLLAGCGPGLLRHREPELGMMAPAGPLARLGPLVGSVNVQAWRTQEDQGEVDFYIELAMPEDRTCEVILRETLLIHGRPETEHVLQSRNGPFEEGMLKYQGHCRIEGFSASLEVPLKVRIRAMVDGALQEQTFQTRLIDLSGTSGSRR